MKKRLLALLLIVCFVMAIPCQASAATATTVTQKKITIHKPGEEICTKVPKTYKEKGVARDSLGYRAYMYTSGGVKYGFVTCGHSLDKSTDGKVYAKDQKTVIGTIIENGIKIGPASSTLDYTFVELAKGHDVSDYTVYGKKTYRFRNS